MPVPIGLTEITELTCKECNQNLINDTAISRLPCFCMYHTACVQKMIKKANPLPPKCTAHSPHFRFRADAEVPIVDNEDIPNFPDRVFKESKGGCKAVTYNEDGCRFCQKAVTRKDEFCVMQPCGHLVHKKCLETAESKPNDVKKACEVKRIFGKDYINGKNCRCIACLDKCQYIENVFALDDENNVSLHNRDPEEVNPVKKPSPQSLPAESNRPLQSRIVPSNTLTRLGVRIPGGNSINLVPDTNTHKYVRDLHGDYHLVEIEGELCVVCQIPLLTSLGDPEDGIVLTDLDKEKVKCSLPCLHSYHIECVKSMNKKGKNECPQCRKPFYNYIVVGGGRTQGSFFGNFSNLQTTYPEPYDIQEGLRNDAYCQFCLTSLKHSEEIAVMNPCRHIFHKPCVDHFRFGLSTDCFVNRCPVCDFDPKNVENKHGQKWIMQNNSTGYDLFDTRVIGHFLYPLHPEIAAKQRR